MLPDTVSNLLPSDDRARRTMLSYQVINSFVAAMEGEKKEKNAYERTESQQKPNEIEQKVFKAPKTKTNKKKDKKYAVVSQNCQRKKQPMKKKNIKKVIIKQDLDFTDFENLPKHPEERHNGEIKKEDMTWDA